MFKLSKYRMMFLVSALIVVALLVVLFFMHASLFMGRGLGGPSGESQGSFMPEGMSVSMFHYYNDALMYGFDYPQALSIADKNAQYPERNMTAVFPAGFFTIRPSTLDQADLYGRVTSYPCSKVDQYNSFATTSPELLAMMTSPGTTSDTQGTSSVLISKSAVAFNFREFHDAGAGNLYDTYEYTVAHGNQCVRIGVQDHQANPGMVYDNQSDIAQAQADNILIRNELLAVLKKTVSTFVVGPSAIILNRVPAASSTASTTKAK